MPRPVQEALLASARGGGVGRRRRASSSRVVAAQREGVGARATLGSRGRERRRRGFGGSLDELRVVSNGGIEDGGETYRRPAIPTRPNPNDDDVVVSAVSAVVLGVVGVVGRRWASMGIGVPSCVVVVVVVVVLLFGGGDGGWRACKYSPRR
jgi:hypothetical protein